eukprot:Gb_35280 [translate_table: standard]
MEKLSMEERHWRHHHLHIPIFGREERSIGVFLGFWSSINGGAIFLWSLVCGSWRRILMVILEREHKSFITGWFSKHISPSFSGCNKLHELGVVKFV